ncbi:MAG TPA: monovalent cation/H(+) antiporter subunit G [Dehalococcoidia bacterium]|nr:monovalent cation/H(+) antiporter subunit G [Dehalococcoidia bacterium]
MSIVVILLILSGLFFLVGAAIGMVRLPDVFTRAHALGLTDTLGLTLVLFGVACYQGFTLSAVKTVLILVLLCLFNPVITHVGLRAALRTGLQPWTHEEGEGA